MSILRCLLRIQPTQRITDLTVGVSPLLVDRVTDPCALTSATGVLTMTTYECRRCGMTDNVQLQSCHGCGVSFPFKPQSPSPSTPAHNHGQAPARRPYGFREDGSPVWTLPAPPGRFYGFPRSNGFVPILDHDSGKTTGGGWACWYGSPVYPWAVANAALNYERKNDND